MGFLISGNTDESEVDAFIEETLRCEQTGKHAKASRAATKVGGADDSVHSNSAPAAPAPTVPPPAWYGGKVPPIYPMGVPTSQLRLLWRQSVGRKSSCCCESTIGDSISPSAAAVSSGKGNGAGGAAAGTGSQPFQKSAPAGGNRGAASLGLVWLVLQEVG